MCCKNFNSHGDPENINTICFMRTSRVEGRNQFCLRITDTLQKPTAVVQIDAFFSFWLRVLD